MINTRFTWYLEKYRRLDRSQCGFRKHPSMTDHLMSLEMYFRDPFAPRQQAVGLFCDLEKAYETTWQYDLIPDLHRTILCGEFYPEEGVPTGGVLAVTCFGLKIKQLPSCIARTWKRPMKQPGNMTSFQTFTGPYSLANSTQRKVFQLAVSSLWHVSDWRSNSCPRVLPGTISERYLSMTWQSVFMGAQWTP